MSAEALIAHLASDLGWAVFIVVFLLGTLLGWSSRIVGWWVFLFGCSIALLAGYSIGHF